MKPDTRFLKQPKYFWANVRSVSQHVGYTERSTGRIRVPSLKEIAKALEDLGLRSSHVIGEGNQPTELGANLAAYFEHRASVLYEVARPHLMNAAKARKIFRQLRKKLKPKWTVPMNKQKGTKKAEAYFTGIINMLIETNCEELPCDYSPRGLTSVTVDGAPVRTLARWVDGAFPSTENPIAIWETKEYYYTTTFGSRVADGVYESLLDGMELEELREHEHIDVKHYLMVDAYDTWWNMGRSYLCRIVDMLHMGYVDEVLFGSEVLERVPLLVKEWVAAARQREEVRE
ncbi:MAG: hypothetical protein HY234_14950 [Acidobacteria bacterium]|nr:hypothetical protein [Acidobacteriota bacterium]